MQEKIVKRFKLTDKGIVNEKDEPYESLTDAVFVLLLSNKIGYIMVIFEKNVLKGNALIKSYITINIEYKFSYLQSTTKESKNCIEGKNSKIHDKYLPYF
ncbi:15939_t:CDS:1 [Funneliformis geosporum]|uniref:9173_t:CDS:1 n=1 Tax=Funneliformis geosporum TaxID=1117311 RepID=A0A9W4T0X5_9GLOM|nr:15939_t:CDS:1 [Funneliformis geosporum]CAI2190617.1 9173_t:CDS:1 [Funneliformis geosporum]